MDFDWNEKIYGFSLLRIRDAFKHAYFSVGPTDLARYFPLGPEEADEFLEELEDRGYLALKQEGGKREYQVTPLLRRLACAKAIPRIPRAKAELILQGLIERVKAMNADPEWTYSVREVWVFGSYLNPAADTLGDLDVCVISRPRDTFGSFLEQCEFIAAQSGKPHIKSYDAQSFCEMQTRNRIKNRNQYISFQDLDTMRGMGAELRLIYSLNEVVCTPETSQVPAQ